MTLNKIDSTKKWSTDERESYTPENKQTKTSEVTIEFDKWHGQYREIPELQGVLDRLTLWVIYGGDDTEATAKAEIEFETEQDKKKFQKITGYGKDTPEEVLSNLFRVGKICGTSCGEIIKTTKKGFSNLKPLDPGTIKIRMDSSGFIESFEQVQIKPGADGEEKTNLEPIKPENMFYIAWNRVADEIIGIPTGEKLESIIDWRHQAMQDLAEVYHRYTNPFWLFYVNTDDDDEIDDFNNKIKKIFNQKGKDHLTIPEETVAKHERLGIPQFSTLDPLNWIKHLERYFLISEGVPELISGIGRETADAASRMIYLAWRIITIANQKIFEKHIDHQLGIKLNLPRPVNILAPNITGERSEVPTPDAKGKNQNG